MSFGPKFSNTNAILTISVAAIIVGLVVWIAILVVPIKKHRSYYKRIEVVVADLANKRPEKFSRDEWSFIIGWTQNALGNCFAFHTAIKEPNEFYDFCIEAENRIQTGEDAGVSIEWIWDELPSLSHYGADYERSRRPTSNDRLKEASRTQIGPVVP